MQRIFPLGARQKLAMLILWYFVSSSIISRPSPNLTEYLVSPLQQTNCDVLLDERNVRCNWIQADILKRTTGLWVSTLNSLVLYYNFHSLTTPCGCNYRGIKMLGQKVEVVAKIEVVEPENVLKNGADVALSRNLNWQDARRTGSSIGGRMSPLAGDNGCLRVCVLAIEFYCSKIVRKITQLSETVRLWPASYNLSLLLGLPRLNWKG